MSSACPRCLPAGWMLGTSVERIGQLVCNGCGRYFLRDGATLVELDEESSKSLAALQVFQGALHRHLARKR